MRTIFCLIFVAVCSLRLIIIIVFFYQETICNMINSVSLFKSLRVRNKSNIGRHCKTEKEEKEEKKKRRKTATVIYAL